MVYRIEDDKGIGVYRSEISPEWIDSNDRTKPTPWEDEELLKSTNIHVDDKYYVIEDYSFGFKSVSQMLKWFKKEQLKTLTELGFNINIYMVDDTKAHSSKHQAMFKKKHAQLVRTLKIEELL